MLNGVVDTEKYSSLRYHNKLWLLQNSLMLQLNLMLLYIYYLCNLLKKIEKGLDISRWNICLKGNKSCECQKNQLTERYSTISKKFQGFRYYRYYIHTPKYITSTSYLIYTHYRIVMTSKSCQWNGQYVLKLLRKYELYKWINH